MTTFELVAGLASIVGLVFSFLAFVQAKRASRAAREARDGILVRTLVDEIELACARLDQLLDLLQHDRIAEAGMIAHGLTSALSEIPFRKSPYLDENRKNDLLNLRAQLQIIEQEISASRGQPMAAKKKQTLVRICQAGSSTLREILGTMKKQLDLGGKR